MTSLKTRPDSGQAVIESVIGVCFMIIFFITAFILAVHAIASLVMAKWAGQHSLCLVKNPQFICEKKTATELDTFFALRSVQIRSSTTRGIIHSEIKAELIDHTYLRVNYDLTPSEYKRVGQ